MRRGVSSMSGASTAEAPGRGTLPATAGTLVIGLGNPVLGDDGVGWLVVRRADARWAEARRARAPGVDFDLLAVGGLALMERLVGARRAILVDAVLTGLDPAGTVRLLEPGTIPGRDATHLDSPHDVTLRTALELGRTLGAALPDEIAIVTIEAQRVGEFTERLTPAVAAAVPGAVEQVLALLGDR